MSLIRNSATEIYIDPASSRCRVVEAVTRRTYYSTTDLVALALLSHANGSAAEARSRQLSWQDHLASHGIAIGTHGNSINTLAVIPPTRRTISYLGGNDSAASFQITLPHMLVGLRIVNGRFVRAVMYLVRKDALAHLGVANEARVLAPFPYGNVYTATGQICWGTVRHNSIRTISQLLDTFFGSGFNRDLYGGPDGSLSLHIERCPGGILPEPSTDRYNLTIEFGIGQLVSRA